MKRLKNLSLVMLFCLSTVVVQNQPISNDPAFFGWVGTYAKNQKRQYMLVAANIACDGCWTLAIAGSGVSAGASFLVGAVLTA